MNASSSLIHSYILSQALLCNPPSPPQLTATRAEDELYFTNLSNILSIQPDHNNSLPQVVIDNLELAEALDCNPCDNMIYWVDQTGKIKRGYPHGGNVEVVRHYVFVFMRECFS